MTKNLLRFLFIFSFVLASTKTEAQGSDFQCTPTEIGLLPFASPPCSFGSGFGYGSIVTVNGSTIGATNDSLSGMITSCYSGTPLNDVWFAFTASEPHVEIKIQGIGATPLSDSYVAIYEVLTDECVGLIPRQCSMGSGTGMHMMEFGPLTLGVRYYLQIASGSGSSTGDGFFNMVINSKNICADCSRNSLLQTYPLPVNAAYPPDTTVGFCYTVLGYNEQYGNRFHGVVPLFGSGWDASTLTIYSAADSVDFMGEWKWFSNINIGGTSGIVSGFFYDVGGDNDPTNNLGDDGTFTSTWTFCFTIKTQTAALCNAGQTDLSIRFLLFADGESGSLVSTDDCSGDEDYTFDAHMECCPKPYGVVPQAAGCNTTPDGSIVAYAGFSFFGHNYFLYSSDGVLVATHTSAPGSTSPYTFAGLLEGNYYLFFNENTAGACQTAMNIYVPGPVDYDIHQTIYDCPGGITCLNSAQVIINSGGVSSITWTNSGGTVLSTGTSADSLCTGWNYVTIVDTGIVACYIVDSVFITSLPNASPYFDYNLSIYCTSDSLAVLSDFPAGGGGTFSMLWSPPGIASTDINASTGSIDISGASTSGSIIVKYLTPPPCSNSHVDTIYIELSPPSPLATDFPSQSLCVGDVVNSYYNSSAYNVLWYIDSALTLFVTNQAPGTTFDYFGGGPQATPGNYILYLMAMNAINSCKSTALAVTVNVYPAPVLDAGNPLSVCPGFGINLNCTGANSFLWSPSSALDNPTLASPVASLSSTTLFTVVGTDATSGCSSIDTVTVFVVENGSCDIIVYNGFTPNGDNSNDFWYIDGISVDLKNQVSIFNRWGDKIWEAVGYDNTGTRWEGRSAGKKVPTGTYFYVIRFKDTTLTGYVELTQ